MKAWRSLPLFAALVLGASWQPRQAGAVDGTWTATTSGSWGTAGNWLNNVIGTGTGSTATFGADIASDVTVTNNQQRAIGGLVFGIVGGTGAGGWIITGSNLVLNNNVTGPANATITVNSATATINTVIASTTSNNPVIVKGGTGTLVLSASTSLSSKFSITGGTLQISNNNQLGANPGTFIADQLSISNGATLRTTASGTLGQNRGITIGPGGGTLSINGGGLTYAGRFTGTGQTATVRGANALTISNATGTPTDVNWDFASNSSVRTFFEGSNALGTGSVRVRNGVRLTSQSTASGTLANAVTLDSGAGLTARSSGRAVTYSNVIFPSSGSVVFNKDDQTTAALTISSGVELSGTLTIDTSQGGSNPVGDVTLSGIFSGTGGLVKSGTGASGRLILAGANTYSGTTRVATGSLLVNGDQSAATGPVLVASGATLAGTGTVGGATTIQSGATLAPGSSPGSLTFTQGLTLAAGGNYNWQILDATGTAGAATGWDLANVGGVLDVASTSGDPFKINLWSLSSTGPDVNGDVLNFNSSQGYTWTIASATGGITGFDADKFQIITGATNGTGGFANAFTGTFSLALSGSTDLNLVYTAGAPTVITIDVPSGTQTQTQAGHPLLSGSTPVEKIGAGTVVFDQPNTLTGPTTVSQGTLELATANTLASSPVTVAAGATLSVGPQVAAVVPALVNNGLVDVGLGGLTVTSGQTAEGIVAAIIAGRTDGTWSGTSGITSSAAATQSERAVGWLDNGDGSFTVAFGAAGDWNLNGVVDFDDVVQFVSANLYDTGLPATWADGDYDYNGVVDFDDVVASVSANLFDTGPYNTAPGGLSALGFGGGDDLGLVSGGFAAVPEPSAWLLLALGAGCLAGWSHRVPRRRAIATSATVRS